MLKQIFNKFFLNAAIAADGVEALALARRHRPDLILSDVMMPRLDGFGLLRELRNDRQLATIPVVFLSARAGEEAAIEGLHAGADDYLVKPFSALELLARVRANLELGRFRNQEATWRRALVESLHDAVVVSDSAANVIEANPAFERILGFSAEAVPYKPPYPWWADAEGQPEEFRQLEGVLAQVPGHRPVSGHHRPLPPRRPPRPRRRLGQVDLRTRKPDVRHDVPGRDRRDRRGGAGGGARPSRRGARRGGHGFRGRRRRSGRVRAAFGAARVMVVTSRRGTPSEEGWAALDGDVQAALLASRDGGGVSELNSPGGRCRGVTGPVEPGEDGAAVWLELDPPRPLDTDDRALFGVLCRYLGQARRRAQLFDDSQAVATAMQRAILGPAAVPGGVAVRYAPAVRPLEVGGDWYDAVELPDGRIGLVVGDCVGRGLGAATVMGQIRSACRALLLQAKNPAEVIGALDTFAEQIPEAACTTVFCAAVDPAQGTVTYSSAGHVRASSWRPTAAPECSTAPGRSRCDPLWDGPPRSDHHPPARRLARPLHRRARRTAPGEPRGGSGPPRRRGPIRARPRP